jgi:hypothetical protein
MGEGFCLEALRGNRTEAMPAEIATANFAEFIFFSTHFGE